MGDKALQASAYADGLRAALAATSRVHDLITNEARAYDKGQRRACKRIADGIQHLLDEATAGQAG